MGQIKVDPDRLEEFADKIGDAKSSCGDALSALKWHFSSLIAEVSDIEGGYASELYQQLVNHIEHYQNLLDQSQAVVKRTAAEFRQADESWFGHLLDVGAEILPIHDFQRLFGEYDPVTGEKLGFGDRLLAFGMIASSIFPPARGAGLLVKTGIKGVKMIKMSEEGAKLVKGVKNVLNPDLIKNAFRNSYQAVRNQSLSLTNKIVKKAGDIRIPQVLQPEFAGIGKIDTTVRDVINNTKDNMMKAVSKKDGSITISIKSNEQISEVNTIKAEDIIAERAKNFDLKEHPISYKQISAKKMNELKLKIKNRTITKEEYKSYIWNKKFARRRDKGVIQFWKQERKRIKNGEKPTRNWSEKQIKDILNKKRPKFNGKTLQGHHTYSAAKYPHLANKGEIIYPLTHKEHLYGWHGGNYKNSLPGKPIKDDIEEF